MCIRDRLSKSLGTWDESQGKPFSDGLYPAAVTGIIKVPKWIGDTGAANHMVSPKDLSPEQLDTRHSTPVIHLSTANNIIAANERCEVVLPQLPFVLDPLVLANTPPAISIGRCVIDHKMNYEWHWNSTPKLISSDGKVTTFQVEDYVPYLQTNPSLALPASGVTVK